MGAPVTRRSSHPIVTPLAVGTNKMDVFIQSCDDVITRHTNKNVNKSSGLLFDNFLKINDHFKTNHDNANGFYGAKGSW